ncbi:MAG: hypothetical protein M3082_02300 [Candidatus Dormibacteraeota bacterium]|nr:hypothetical protein [Candidatus Dormibacteraeota bacterium]
MVAVTVAVTVAVRTAVRAGPKLQEQLVKYFGCRFEDFFEVVLVNPETGQVR